MDKDEVNDLFGMIEDDASSAQKALDAGQVKKLPEYVQSILSHCKELVRLLTDKDEPDEPDEAPELEPKDTP